MPRQSPTLPQGLEGGNPLCVKIFLGNVFLPKRLSCFPTISITESHKTNKSACKRQGRPSRGTPTPPVYGYLTRHLPRKITLTWASNPATDEQVRIRKTGGKETRLYITTTKCSGLGGRERHIHIQNKLLWQNQASPGGGSAPPSDDGASGRISASKVDASTAPRPAAAASSL